MLIDASLEAIFQSLINRPLALNSVVTLMGLCNKTVTLLKNDFQSLEIDQFRLKKTTQNLSAFSPSLLWAMTRVAVF